MFPGALVCTTHAAAWVARVRPLRRAALSQLEMLTLGLQVDVQVLMHFMLTAAILRYVCRRLIWSLGCYNGAFVQAEAWELF
jgi:hypothetical protein